MFRHGTSIVSRWDLAASRRISGARVPVAFERGLPLLTRAADKSRLWIAISALLIGTGDRRARRGAVRGLASVAVASVLANQIGKRLVSRSRPALTEVPLVRIARRVPTSSSFPSGHSASAAAFAVGVAVEFPELAVPIGALAGLVAFSRVFTGVHFSSDVLVGATIGAAVAGAGAAVVPAHHRAPASLGQAPARPQRPRPDGRGVTVVVNPRSGGGSGADAAAVLRADLPSADIIELREDDDVAEVMRAAAARAEVLGVAGGDGTINAAASAAIAEGIPLLVVAAGTFNHFAKELRLPSPNEAIEAVQAGRAICIDVGRVNGEVFLNTASLGSYPEFVKIRERWEPRVGKPVAAAVALVHVLRHCPPLAAEVDGVPRRLLMLFIGNGAYEPRGFAPRWRSRLDTGQLDVRLVDSAKPGSTWGLLAAALTGDLYRSARYVEVREPSLTITIAGPNGYLARDGEVADAPSTATFATERGALVVYCGAAEPEGRG